MHRWKQLSGDRVLIVEDFLSEAQCAAWIHRAQQAGVTEAPINSRYGQVRMSEVRNNDRAMIDSVELASELWNALPDFPATSPGHALLGLNERLRFYRYHPGQYFRPHFDGYFHRPGTDQRSIYTFMIYLQQPDAGGDTAFLDLGVQLPATRGLAVAFVHRLAHEGCEVTAGTKWVLRSDIMFDGF